MSQNSPNTSTLRRADVESVVRQVVLEKLAARSARATSSALQVNPLVVNVSARHVHCTPQAVETLFGPGARLTKHKDLYQQGEFAAEQTVTLVGPRQRIIPNVRILGPCRDYTQVELSYTDGVYLGIELPLRISGNHDGSPGITLIGPAGSLTLPRGVIRARRHVHMSQADMRHYGVNDGERMRLRIGGPCALTFDDVVVRHHPKVILEVHIDTDEGNACDLESATSIELFK